MELRNTFNDDASNYDKYRPTYPNDLYKDIFNYGTTIKGDKAVEIGIGTGQATLPFLEKGIHVTAIEIGKNLVDYTQQKYKDYTNLQIIHDDFINVKIPSQSIQLVYSATAFHWLKPEIALPKIYDLLENGGTLALFWNHPYIGRENDLLHQKIRAIYKKYKPNDNSKPLEFDGHTCSSYCEKLTRYGFVDVESKLYHRTRYMNADEYIALLNTYSDHRVLTSDIKMGLETEIHEAILVANNQISIYDTIDLYLARKTRL